MAVGMDLNHREIREYMRLLERKVEALEDIARLVEEALEEFHRKSRGGGDQK